MPMSSFLLFLFGRAGAAQELEARYRRDIHIFVYLMYYGVSLVLLSQSLC